MAHLLSAFIENPTNIRFETQQPEEEIKLLLRAHPITNLGWILVAVLLILAPFIIASALVFIGVNFDSPDSSRIIRIFSVTWELIAIGYIFEQFLNYYFSVYIVTNLRVLDIDFVNLLSKSVSDAQIEDIEDVTYTQNGVARSVFNYGDVVIQTAGAKQAFDFLSVPRPGDVAQIISELQPIGGEND